MKVHLVTPTRLSLIDLTSMGDSVKRGDDTKLGVFDSGLKYSIALFLRAEVRFTIAVYSQGKKEEDYFFDSTLSVCEDTGKKKELITIHQTVKPGTITTGFAKAMGFDWKLWMALREVWSNMLDENGYMVEDADLLTMGEGTVMTLEFEQTNPFFEIWQNRHLYINEEEPLWIVSNGVEILKNPEGWLRIYKQNILVYENPEKKSRFAFNIKFGTIDERRILSAVYSVESTIAGAIVETKNEKFLREIITADFNCKDEFLSSCSNYYTASDLLHDIAVEVYEKHGQVESYEWIIDAIKKRKDCRIGGKIIQTVRDSIYNYSSMVHVESVPETVSEPDIVVDDIPYQSSFSAEIARLYDFKLDVEVKMARLKGSRVVADKYEKCLIIGEDFKVEEDFAEFMVQYIDLTVPGNVVKNMSEYICKLLKWKSA